MTDRYQIIRLIHKDQLGGLYLAEDTVLKREVAFRHFDEGHDAEPDASWQDAFSQYVSKLIALKHPNLLVIYDASIKDDDGIVISQFIEADTVSDCIQRDPLGVKETVSMAMDLLAAMDTMHTAGIYHGAMHTGSIIRLPKAGSPHQYLIVDLGIKRLSSFVTGKDIQIEDPVLLPPELYGKPDAANAQSDLFMVGQLCYTALAGGHPFAEYTSLQCSKAYRAGKTPPLRKFAPNVPPELTAWIMGMIEGSPKRRPASADAAIKVLQGVSLKPSTGKQSGTPVRPQPSAPATTKSRRGVIIGAISLLAIIAGLIFAFLPKDEAPKTDGSTGSKKSALRDQSDNPGTGLTTNDVKKARAANMIQPGPNTPKIMQASKIMPTKSMETKKRVSIDASQYLDWVIPLEKDVKRQSKSPYQLDITWEGRLLGDRYNTHLVDFEIKDGRRAEMAIPRAAQIISSNKKQPQKWDVTFRAPRSHKGPLEMLIYITQQSCDLTFTVTFPNKKQILLESRSKGPGVVKVKLLIPEITPAKLYNIQIEATPLSTAKPWVTGLHGVFLQRLSPQLAKQNQPPKATKPKSKPQSKPTPKPVAKPKPAPQYNGFTPVLQAYSPQNHFNSKKWFHAEGSILKVAEGQYCLYYSRWLKSKSKNARITHPEIAIATSTSSSGPWKYWKTILEGRPEKWDQFGVSHPIIKEFDGEYYLYYVSTSADITQQQLEAAAQQGGKNKNWHTLNNNRCIGVAYALSFKGPWKRMEQPIISAKAPFVGFSCTPSVTRSPDGQYLMMACSKEKSGKTVSYITTSQKPHFPKPVIKGAIAGEGFSYDYSPSTKRYHLWFNGDKNNFLFLQSLDSLRWDQIKFPKPVKLPPSAPVLTSSFHSPNQYFGEDGQPEVFLFYSDDIENGGIFTIPFRKE